MPICMQIQYSLKDEIMKLDLEYKNIPVLAVKGLTVYPYVILSIDALREFSIKAIEQALSENHLIFVTSLYIMNFYS